MRSLGGEHWALQEGDEQVHLPLERGGNLTKGIPHTFCAREMRENDLDLFDLQGPNTSSYKIPVTQGTFVLSPAAWAMSSLDSGVFCGT